MLGNPVGELFRVTACGGSYGKTLQIVVDELPRWLRLTNGMTQQELDKRKTGQRKAGFI